MSAPDSLLPPVCPTLRVGVTGHIHLAGADRTALAQGARAVLEQIRKAAFNVAGASFADGAPSTNTGQPPRLVLVSPLAAGADQLVAEQALELGFELEAPLPFLAEEFEQDFHDDPEGLDQFRRLRAQARRVLELGAARAPAGSVARNLAYDTVGWVLLSQSDLLIGIWDGQPARGEGGTARVVERALEAGLPVVQLKPTTPSAPRLCVGGAGESNCTVSIEGLQAVVQRLLSPFRPMAAATGPGPIARLLDAQRDAQACYLEERDGSAGSPLGRIERWLLPRTWRWFLALAGPRSSTHRPLSAGPQPAPPSPHPTHATWAGALADQYQGLYRGAFLCMYLLGALAVSMALFGVANHLAHGSHSWSIRFAAGELLVLGLILLLYARAKVGRWHSKGTNYRVLGELLRHEEALTPLGIGPPVPRPRAHLGGEADLTLTWMVSHHRAVARDRGLTTARFDAGELSRVRRLLQHDWIEGQVAYHRRVAHAFHCVAHRMEIAAVVLFLGALAACTLHFVLPHDQGPWLSLVAAGLPAWGAACHGILGSADLPRLAMRSEAMATRLEAAGAELGQVPDSALTWRLLAVFARRTCADMLGELDDWQALARHRDVRLP